MNRYLEIPKGYTIEQIEEKFPFLKNAEIENVEIKFNENNKLYWDKGRFHNGTFTNSFWDYGNFKNGKFINSFWNNGHFHNGTFINSYWDYGTFYNGKFINSYWSNGYIYSGFFINSFIKKIDKFNKFKDYSKAKFHNCIVLEPRLLELNRTYSKLTFKGIK